MNADIAMMLYVFRVVISICLLKVKFLQMHSFIVQYAIAWLKHAYAYNTQ